MKVPSFCFHLRFPIFLSCAHSGCLIKKPGADQRLTPDPAPPQSEAGFRKKLRSQKPLAVHLVSQALGMEASPWRLGTTPIQGSDVRDSAEFLPGTPGIWQVLEYVQEFFLDSSLGVTSSVAKTYPV